MLRCQESLEVFEKIYYRIGRLQFCPDFVEPKVKPYVKVAPAKPQPPADKTRDSRQCPEGQKTPAKTSETVAKETAFAANEGQHQDEQDGSKLTSEGNPHSQHASDKSQNPVKKPESTAVFDKQDVKKKIARKEPTSFALDEKKLQGEGVQSRMKSQECEFLVLQLIKEVLEEITGPEDPPVFIFHNHDLRVKGKADTSEGEKDVLIVHATLGVLVLEVKGTETTKIYFRFDKATTQLLHAQTSLKEEMGDLLEDDAIVLTIVLPNLQPEDSTIIRQEAEARKALKERTEAKSQSKAAEEKQEDVPGSGDGDSGQKSKVERLEDHPEVRLVCGPKVEVYAEWVRELQAYRARTSHAFRGSTDEARLDSFKRACARRCSVAMKRPGQTVKDLADLHSRFLLTREQLQVRDSQAELLHISGPPGSGKTLLLSARARRWLREDRPLALAVGSSTQDLLLRHLVWSVCGKDAHPIKISTHNNSRELLQWLPTVSPPQRISVIIDEALGSVDFYLELLQRVREGRICALWTADTRRLPDDFQRELSDLQGTSVHLSQCLRCPSSVIDLVNSVRSQEESPLEHPEVPVTKELGVGVELISHFDHAHHSPRDTCPACREGVLGFFSSLGLSPTLTRSALSWRDVVVITIWNEQRQQVAEWLQDLKMPALAERNAPMDRIAKKVPLPGATPKDAIEADKEAVRRRVMAGEDSVGKEALHVVWGADFRGLEKPVVVLWHEDLEDQDKDRQRQDLRDSRLLRHRELWFQAASRCQGRLLVVAATPSPALALLPHPQPRLDFSAFKTTFLFHHSHSQRDLPYWRCGECGQDLVQRLQSLGLPLCSAPTPDLCRRVVVVLTGWSCDGSRAATWLRGLGLPVVFSEPQRGLLFETYDPSAVAEWKARVEAGEDDHGHPSIHVVRDLTHLVPPRPVVVLVHHDQEDTDPEHQSQARRDSRLWSHRVFWRQAASLCQEHLVVMATTPSPVLSTDCLESSAETSA